MSIRTLSTSILALIFSSRISFNFSQLGNHQDGFIFDSSNQSLALFMPTEILIVTDVASPNDESC